MYLLNHNPCGCDACPYWFTFHYVSIKSAAQRSARTAEPDLHSTMYLLNRFYALILVVFRKNLHSTMYLLNRRQDSLLIQPQKDLHSTMYLLNRTTTVWAVSRAEYLHSTMYLLNRHILCSSEACPVYLHSTMYLLNQGWSVCSRWYSRIYIPLCIY